jgi:ABC-type sugar transport system permease subunit
MAGHGSSRWRDALVGYAFLLPSLLPLVLFTLYPLADSGYLSLTKWNLLSPVKQFVGLSNYAAMPRDPVLRQAFANTILYTVTVVPVSVIVGFVLALLLNRPLRLRALWRGIFFLPTVVPIAALSAVWLWIYDPHFGLMNYALQQLHLPTSAWLQSPTSALWAIVLMMIWQTAGYNMVILLAGLQNVPEELHEAARLDGAGWGALLWRITVPMLSPTFLFLVVVSAIQAFRVFDPIYVMTLGLGGPANSTTTLVFHMYRQAFMFLEVGYASAIAYVIVGIALLFTAAQMGLAKRWVTYD